MGRIVCLRSDKKEIFALAPSCVGALGIVTRFLCVRFKQAASVWGFQMKRNTESFARPSMHADLFTHGGYTNASAVASRRRHPASSPSLMRAQDDKHAESKRVPHGNPDANKQGALLTFFHMPILIATRRRMIQPRPVTTLF